MGMHVAERRQDVADNDGAQISQPNKGPFPCTSDFPDPATIKPSPISSTRKSPPISWKYYTPAPIKETVGALWNAFLAIASVCNGQGQCAPNISSPETNIFSDISNGELPAMSWVIPDAQNSDHPGFSSKDTGPSWVASVVNAIGESHYWNSTAVIVVWDDWGGFYDPVAPPFVDDQGGRRIPRRDAGRLALREDGKRQSRRLHLQHRLRVRQHRQIHRRHLEVGAARNDGRNARRASPTCSTSSRRRVRSKRFRLDAIRRRSSSVSSPRACRSIPSSAAYCSSGIRLSLG